MSAPYEPLAVRSQVLVFALLSIFGAQQPGWARQEHRPPPPTAQGELHRTDPCEENVPKGVAVGWERHCAPVGGGNGIARGDFNGDGFADLAIGVPNDDVTVGGVLFADAGAVNVVYGANNNSGLTTFGNQYWHQGQTAHGFVQGDLEAGDTFGTAVAAVDLDSNQFMDLIIGVPNESVQGVFHAGAVNVLLGGPNGLTAAGNFLVHQGGSPWRLDDAPEAHDHFGMSLTWGFFNQDASADVAIGVPNEDVQTTTGATITDAGAVVVAFGPGGTVDAFLHQDLPNIPTDAEMDDAFGQTLGVGDFNNDLFDDLVIGTPREDLTLSGVFYEDPGMVTVLYGGGLFLNVNPPVPNQAHHQGTLFPSGGGQDGRLAINPGDLFGAAVTSGDFNGDGFDDLAIGVPQEDTAFQSNSGAVNVVYGSSAGLSRFGGRSPHGLIQATLDPAEPGDQFGFALTAGDFDADGLRDVAVGAPFEDLRDFVRGCAVDHINAGAVMVFYSAAGSGAGGKSSQFLFQGGSTAIAQPRYQWGNNQFGYSLTAWNFGRGPNTDLAVGAPGDSASADPDARGCDLSALPPRPPNRSGTVEVLYAPLNLASSANRRLSQTSEFSFVQPGTLQLRGTTRANDGFGKALY